MKKRWWQSATILGAILGAVAHVLGAPPAERIKAAVEGAGIIVAAAGARGAIAKNGSGQ